MRIRCGDVRLSRTLIESGMWHIKRYMMKKYGTAAADREFTPLDWYERSGRASGELLMRIFSAKPFMIGRLLHEGGSYDEAMERIRDYVGFRAEWPEEA